MYSKREVSDFEVVHQSLILGQGALQKYNFPYRGEVAYFYSFEPKEAQDSVHLQNSLKTEQKRTKFTVEVESGKENILKTTLCMLP